MDEDLKEELCCLMEHDRVPETLDEVHLIYSTLLNPEWVEEVDTQLGRYAFCRYVQRVLQPKLIYPPFESTLLEDACIVHERTCPYCSLVSMTEGQRGMLSSHTFKSHEDAARLAVILYHLLDWSVTFDAAKEILARWLGWRETGEEPYNISLSEAIERTLELDISEIGQDLREMRSRTKEDRPREGDRAVGTITLMEHSLFLQELGLKLTIH